MCVWLEHVYMCIAYNDSRPFTTCNLGLRALEAVDDVMMSRVSVAASLWSVMLDRGPAIAALCCLFNTSASTLDV